MVAAGRSQPDKQEPVLRMGLAGRSGRGERSCADGPLPFPRHSSPGWCGSTGPGRRVGIDPLGREVGRQDRRVGGSSRQVRRRSRSPLQMLRSANGRGVDSRSQSRIRPVPSYRNQGSGSRNAGSLVHAGTGTASRAQSASTVAASKAAHGRSAGRAGLGLGRASRSRASG
jgi:hypothetical protein